MERDVVLITSERRPALERERFNCVPYDHVTDTDSISIFGKVGTGLFRIHESSTVPDLDMSHPGTTRRKGNVDSFKDTSRQVYGSTGWCRRRCISRHGKRLSVVRHG